MCLVCHCPPPLSAVLAPAHAHLQQGVQPQPRLHQCQREQGTAGAKEGRVAGRGMAGWGPDGHCGTSHASSRVSAPPACSGFFPELVALRTMPGEDPASQGSCLSLYEPGPLHVPGFVQKLWFTPPFLHSCLKCP